MKNTKQVNQHVQTAVDFAGGTQTSLAKLIGGKCLQGHVHQWLYRHKLPSPFYAKRIEMVTNGLVKAADFHPEIFGDQTAA